LIRINFRRQADRLEYNPRDYFEHKTLKRLHAGLKTFLSAAGLYNFSSGLAVQLPLPGEAGTVDQDRS